MRKALFIFLVLCSSVTDAQTHFTRIIYQDTAFTSGNIDGFCSSIQTTSDGGHLMHLYTGQYHSDGGGYDNVLLVKTDAKFVPQWQKVRGYEGIALKDSSIMTFTNDDFFDSSVSTRIEKRNLQGQVLWAKELYIDSASMMFIGNPVYANSKIRLPGFYQHYGSLNIYVPTFVDIDSTGTIASADSIAGDTTAFEHLFTDDSGNYYFVLAGRFGGGNKSFTKLRPDNTIAWNYTLQESSYDIASMVTLPNGDVILGGNYQRPDTVRTWLMKLSASGSLVWQKTANRPCRLADMKLTKNGSVMIAAGGIPVSGFNYLSEDNLLKIDTGANLIWARNVAPDRTAWPYYLGLSTPYIDTDNGNLYFAAVTQNPYAAMIFSTDSSGHGVCNTDAVSFSFYDTVLFTLQPGTINFASIPVNFVNNPIVDSGERVLFADSCGYRVPPLLVANTSLPANVEIYPNPATGSFYISNSGGVTRIEIFDLTGKLVSEVQGVAADNEINIRNLTNGYYIVRITDKDKIQVNKKLIVMN